MTPKCGWTRIGCHSAGTVLARQSKQDEEGNKNSKLMKVVWLALFCFVLFFPQVTGQLGSCTSKARDTINDAMGEEMIM